jgi:hypothetical protein
MIYTGILYMSFTEFKNGLYRQKSKNLTKLGLDWTNQNIEDEYIKIQQLLELEYFIKYESMLTIMKKYNIPSSRTMDILFRVFEIKSRTLSNAQQIGILNSRNDLGGGSYPYKHGWHTTWENKKVYYRSSYEETYCIYLDENKIRYTMESLRIAYFNTNSSTWRVAVPDFYLPDQNKIIEIKSDYTLDIIEMRCKRDEYLKLGYSFELVVEGKSVLI